MKTKTIENKRKDRRKQTAEVFTPAKLAQEMIDKIPDEFWKDPEKTLLEPSCGDGIFVKLSIIKRLKNKVPLHKAIHNTYAVDIMKDNIQICRKNIIDNVIIKVLKDNFSKKKITLDKYNKQLIELTAMLVHNVKQTKDTLQEDFSKWKTWSEESEAMKNHLRKLTETNLKKKNYLPTECT